MDKTQKPTFAKINLLSFTGENPELDAFLKKCELTDKGYKVAMEAIKTRSFQGGVIEAYDMTKDYGPSISQLSGSVTISPRTTLADGTQSYGRRSGFSFNQTAPQRVILVKGKINTRLRHISKYGQLNGEEECLFVLFPEVDREAIGQDGQVILNPAGRPSYYQPLLRLMLQEFTDKTELTEDGEAQFVKRLMFVSSPVGLGRDLVPNQFGINIPAYIYGTAREIGFTDEDLLVWVTTEAEQERRRNLFPNNARRAAQLAPRPAQPTGIRHNDTVMQD